MHMHHPSSTYSGLSGYLQILTRHISSIHQSIDSQGTINSQLIAKMHTALPLFLLLARFTSAHFMLNYPPPIGAFSDENQPNAPCGGYTPNFSTNNVTDFHVGGDAISTLLAHPQANFLYRITTDEKAQGNWTEIYGIVQQSGLNNWCAPKVSVDPSWVGKKAVLSVVCNAPDGLLYQCAVVNFVSGTSSSTPTACSNSSGVSAAFVQDTTLSALLSSNATSSSPSATNTHSAAATMHGSLEGMYTLMIFGEIGRAHV